jgi:hypothetical protein
MMINRVTERHVIVTAHPDVPSCDHQIAIVGTPINGTPKLHVTLTWGPSAMLGIPNSQEYHQAFALALEIALQMERNGGFDE